MSSTEGRIADEVINGIRLDLPTHEAGLTAHQNKTLSVEAHTGADTLTKEESFSIHTNLGTGSNVLLTLPQDAPAGCSFKFIVMAAWQLQITPGAAGAIYISGAKQTDNKHIWADDEGESVELICDGNNDWMALFATGIWGVES